MVRFNKHKEMVLDCKKHHLMVVDVTSMGAFEANKVTKRLKTEFPQTFMALDLAAFLRKLKPGVVFTYEENGYNFCFMVHADSDVGFVKDPDYKVKEFYEKCIDEVVNIAGIKKLDITSGILGRERKMWDSISKYINIAHTEVAWDIYPD